MPILPSWVRPAAAAAMLLAAGAAHATIVVYTSQTDFLAAVGASGTDTFDDLVPATSYDGPLTRSAGSFSYTVSAGPTSSLLFGAGSAGDAWLSTNFATDTITFTDFSPGAFAAGGFVFGSDRNGDFLQLRKLTVAATDADGTVTQAVARSRTPTFIGFVSDLPLESLTVASVQGRFRPIWPTLNDFIVASPVPEPQTTAMLLAGLAVLGFAAARRRSG